MITIRDLTTFDECLRVVALEKTIWGFSDGADATPAAMLIVSVKRGGILLGAFDDDDAMQGFVYSMPSLKDGRVSQWSHMLGVAPDARAAGIGVRLKLAQRDRALAMGIDLIEWTFDPLQALNAHLNLARLGAVVHEYEENIYGDSSSPLHRGTPTDRFVAEWNLRAPHVERRLDAAAFPAVRDASVRSAPLVNPSTEGTRWLKPAPGGHLPPDAPRLLVEIPTDFGELQADDPALAVEWRYATRAIFQHYLPRGYRIVDFFLSRSARRGQYLLVKGDT